MCQRGAGPYVELLCQRHFLCLFMCLCTFCCAGQPAPHQPGLDDLQACMFLFSIAPRLTLTQTHWHGACTASVCNAPHQTHQKTGNWVAFAPLPIALSMQCSCVCVCVFVSCARSVNELAPMMMMMMMMRQPKT